MWHMLKQQGSTRPLEIKIAGSLNRSDDAADRIAARKYDAAMVNFRLAV